MNVLVVTDIVPDSEDLRIVMMTSGLAPSMVVLAGAARWQNGNPYCVYGKAVEEYTGCNRFNLNITVACCTSGNLDAFLV
jgi:hypothetical protein